VGRYLFLLDYGFVYRSLEILETYGALTESRGKREIERGEGRAGGE
jgi:hypothetical protein